MQTLAAALVAALSFLSLVPRTDAAVVFKDGFENGSLGPKWSISKTNDGRVKVSTKRGPATGAAHLIADDRVDDALYSAAEATLRLNLANKKNVVLSFKAKSLENEPHPPPAGNFSGERAYDGVAISADGGATWRTVQSLEAVPAAWTAYSIALDPSVAALDGRFDRGFRIRFSAYDNGPAPLDGIAFDDVSITADLDQRAEFELPTPLTEGTGPHVGRVLLAFASKKSMILALSASPAGEITLPASVKIRAGRTSASFQFSVNDDEVVNPQRTVTITATAEGVVLGSGAIEIVDADQALLTLTLPSTLTEGGLPTDNASVSIDRLTTVPLTIDLTALPSGEITIPSSVTIPAGETQVAFTARAVDDVKLDGEVPVTVSASGSDLASVTAETVALDNEARTLSVTAPATVQEGATATGTVTVSGPVTSPLQISLTSSNEAALTVPATVTIPAGKTSASFPIAAADNTAADGTLSVSITAAASTFTSASRAVLVRDNDPASYRFGTLGEILAISSPVTITIAAFDVEGNAISGFSGAVDLSVLLPDGSVQPLNPASVTLSGGAWTGAVTIPSVNAAPLRLRATDAFGRSGESSPFDTLRLVNVKAADLVWDAGRSRIYASVPSVGGGVYANKVVVIDPSTAQITGNVALSQDPGPLALTSGGENLYVALNANGTISRITPDNLAVAANFPVGTDPSFGTLYAEDLCTVAGQPNLLVVSQFRKSVSPRHGGVAVYENGVARGAKTQDHTGSNVIEPSADPTLFFGYNNETTEFGFRHLRVDAAGIREEAVKRDLIDGFSTDIRSDGDRVFSFTGVAVDGLQMRRLGTFAASGLVRPDLASNRVFFLEPQGNFSSEYNKLSAHDPTTLTLIRRVTLPSSFSSPGGFIRWGANGLAFRAGNSVVLIASSQLVPSDPPADLRTTVAATPNPATAGATLTYTVQVTNHGPNPARNTLLTSTLSDGQTLQNVEASTGTVSTRGLNITLSVGELAAGAAATLTIAALPQSAGSLTCRASATSSAIDANFSDNIAFKLVSVGFQSGSDSVNQLRMTANNLIHDPTRNVLWASIPASVDAPLGRSIVSINPTNGLISDPLPINANPFPGAMALSANGRYLYVGLTDSPEVHRVDLSANPPTSIRIPLGASQWGDTNYAQDIEVLAGDGTSFLISGASDHSAIVYDGATRRNDRTSIYSVDRIERTGSPDTFIGYNNYTSGFQISKLVVSAAGVTATESVSNVISGYYVDIRGEGNRVLSSTGKLVNTDTLTLVASLDFNGRPCVDAPANRAYLVSGNALRAFNATTGNPEGTFALPASQGGDWALACVRWGADGFGILDDDKIYIARWSAVAATVPDQNRDGIPDRWAMDYFATGDLKADGDDDGDGIPNSLEYFFAASPLQASPSPITATVSAVDGEAVIHLRYSRRAAVTPRSFRYEISSDLTNWEPASAVTETVLSTATVAEVAVVGIDAAIPCAKRSRAFVRIKWLAP